MTDMTFYCRGCEEELPKKKKREKKETTYYRLKKELIDTKCERDNWKEASKGWSKRVDELLKGSDEQWDVSVKLFWLGLLGWSTVIALSIYILIF